MVLKYLKFVVKNYLFAVLSLIFAIAYWISAKELPEDSLTFSYPVLFCLIPLLIWNIAKSVVDFRKTLADQQTPEKENGTAPCISPSPK